MELIIGQINAQRSITAAASLRKLLDDELIDILCVQEPYVYKGKVQGYTSLADKVIQPTVGIPWVAAVIKNEKIETFSVATSNAALIMCFRAQFYDEVMYIINVYCQYSLPIESVLLNLEKLIQEIKTSRFIICMDANAKSEAWYSGETDDRGRVLEEFIVTNNLIVLNKRSVLTTFSGPLGATNIDVTLIGQGFGGVRFDWEVTNKEQVSDHNLIVIRIKLNVCEGILTERSGYNVRAANWERFRTEIGQVFDGEFIDGLRLSRPSVVVKRVTESLIEVCRRTIPARKLRSRSVPWWSRELDRLRKDARGKRKQLTRA